MIATIAGRNGTKYSLYLPGCTTKTNKYFYTATSCNSGSYMYVGNRVIVEKVSGTYLIIDKVKK